MMNNFSSQIKYYASFDVNPETNAKYKKKYLKLKRLVKDTMIENAALCDQVSKLQEKLITTKEERRFLLKKLYSFQAPSDNDTQGTSEARNQGSGSSLSTGSQELAPTSIAKKPNSIKKTKSSSDLIAESLRTAPVRSGKKSGSSGRLKKLVQPIPLDPTGRPKYPIILGALTVHSLGEAMNDRPSYYTEDLIYPVGFCSSRVYGSLKNPEQKCIFTCKISDGGQAPRFEISSDNHLDNPITASTANQCHAMLLKHVNNALGMEVVKAQGKGPEFFGFSVPTIHNLIQSSAGSKKFPGYRSVKFEVCRTGDHTDPTENDALINFDALQRSITFTRQHLSEVTIKEEPQECASTSLRDLLTQFL